MPNTNIKNLLFIPYTFTNGGGAEKILQILVNNLSKEKYKIDIQEVEQFNKFLEINDNVNLRMAFMNQNLPERSFNELNFILLTYFPTLLKNVFRLHNYEAIITFNYQLPSFMLPAFKNTKKIAWFHGDLYDLEEKDKLWERKKQEKVWHQADKIISISNKSKKSLFDIFPMFSGKCKIIHNGTDTKKILEKSNEDLDIPFTNIPYVVCVGRLDENKNFILAIKAIAELNKNGINCAIVLVGEGNQHEYLLRQAKELGINEKVFFAGFQTNPYKYIKNSRCLCVTSFSEGWPTVVMETMALGIPFVTTPVAGASDELSAGGKCGLVAGYNEKEYAAELKKLITDEKLYNEMSHNCLENVKEYSAEKYVQNFENLLNEIDSKSQKKEYILISDFFSYIIYFLLFIFSIGEIIFRIKVICKRIKEKRKIKIFKNIIYLFGIFVTLPFTFVLKCLYYPFYIRKIIKKSGGKCR